MAASFLSLPSELQNEIYNHLLVRREPVRSWSRANELASNLPFTNETILHEVSSPLYGNNCFDLTAWNSGLFDAISFVNASHLQYIRIDFPGLLDLEDEVSLEEGSLYILEKIQSFCINLKYLTTTPSNTYNMWCQTYSFDSPVICCRALALVAAQFSAIPPIQEIFVEIYDDGLSSDVRRKNRVMGGHLRWWSQWKKRLERW